MDLQKLLSVMMATLAALGTLLLAMGQPGPWAALVLWMAVVVSLAVNDFSGRFRLSRNVACFLGIVVLVVLAPNSFRYDGEARLLALVDLLTYLQVIFLFQQKDERVYWWQAVMSLLQVVVAAGLNQGVAFGAILVVYMLVGMVGLTLLILYSEWCRHGKTTDTPRWPLATIETDFTSMPAGSNRSGLVRELFARLGVLGVGTLALAMVIFFTVPRLGRPAWRGMARSIRQVVGFNDKISLGEMGEILESREEVMRVKLRELYSDSFGPLCSVLDELYIRGAVVTRYEHNQWSCEPDAALLAASLATRETPVASDAAKTQHVIAQTIAVEPLDHDDLFYVWPLVTPVRSEKVAYDPVTERLSRGFQFRGQPFEFSLKTTALVDGKQAVLVPSDRPVDVEPLLQSPRLPRVAALANRWVKESRLPPKLHYDIARLLERKLSSSGEFQYTLQGPERDPSIDAVEDFVSNNPRGHCEYFATALALMLRSQGIPSRVVLGYRCDEWNDVGEYYQVRQLHAHAWVEAYLGPEQTAESEVRRAESRQGKLPTLRSPLSAGHPLGGSSLPYGGWLRLDGTPPGDVGTAAADRSTWGQWQSRFHRLQSAWNNYVVEMDRDRQHKALYAPLAGAIRTAIRNLRDPQWWRNLGSSLGAALGAIARHGIIGWLLGIGLALVAVLALAAAVWGMWRLTRRIWRRLLGRGPAARFRARSPVEFYHRFETLLARHGLVRGAGQTPREFARVAGQSLAQQSGRGELASLSAELVEAFYCVRFGGRPLDNSGVQAVEHALEQLVGAISNRS